MRSAMALSVAGLEATCSVTVRSPFSPFSSFLAAL